MDPGEIHAGSVNRAMDLKVTYDRPRNCLVMVGKDLVDYRVWWSTLSLPMDSSLAWSDRVYVSMPAEARVVPRSRIALVADDAQGAIAAVPVTTSGVAGVALFRAGDPSVVVLKGPSDSPAPRSLAAAGTPSAGLQLLLAAMDMDDQHHVWWQNHQSSNWPPTPVSYGWWDWGKADQQTPAFAFSSEFTFAMKVEGRSLKLCYGLHEQGHARYDYDYSHWRDGGNPTGAAMGDPVPMTWYSALRGAPRKFAVWWRSDAFGSPEYGSLYWARQESEWLGAVEHIGAWEKIDGVTTTRDPVCVAWASRAPVLVNENGRLVFALYSSDKGRVTEWRSASSLDNIEAFTGAVVRGTRASSTMNVLITIGQPSDRSGLWVTPILLPD